MKKILTLALIAAAPCFAQASIIFSDNFNGNPYGLSTVPDGWTVTDGTVDVVGPISWATLCNGGTGNVCIDLDGSTQNAGILSKSFNLTAGVNYTATFDMAGNQRGGSDTVTIQFGTASLAFSPLLSTSPWTTYTLNFTPTSTASYSLTFNNAGGDNIGAVIDNVSITAVPEPETLAMLLAGLGLIGSVVRRKAKAA